MNIVVAVVAFMLSTLTIQVSPLRCQSSPSGQSSGRASESASHPWMDEMRTNGVKLARVTFEFDWTEGGRQLTNWKCVSEEYFRDYNQRDRIVDEDELRRIKMTGLDATLENVALSRAKVRNWFEYPHQKQGTGYVTIILADILRELDAHAGSLYGAYDPGTTPLMHAALLGSAGYAKESLHRGADVNAFSSTGCTALIYAAATNNTDIVQLLVNAGAKVNAHNGQCGNALASAVLTNHPQNVEILLKAGANPNLPDVEGNTPLKIATENHYEEVAAILRKAGAHE